MGILFWGCYRSGPSPVVFQNGDYATSRRRALIKRTKQNRLRKLPKWNKKRDARRHVKEASVEFNEMKRKKTISITSAEKKNNEGKKKKRKKREKKAETLQGQVE